MPPTECGDAIAKIRLGKPWRSFGGAFSAVRRVRGAEELDERLRELPRLRLRGAGMATSLGVSSG
jgi:hypothetical protein